MNYHKVFLASFFSLILIGINARADDAPVIDLNTLPDDTASFSQDIALDQTSTSDTLAARQSLPMAERVRLLEQQINNLTQMNLPAKIDNLEQRINQLNGQLEEQAHTIAQSQEQQKLLQENTNPQKPATITMTEHAISADTSADDKQISSSVKKKNNDAEVKETTESSSPIVAAETAVVRNKSSTKNLHGSATVTTSSDEKAYQTAFDLMVKKKNAAAITDFKNFLKNYPNSTYTPSAHYWLGELYSATNAATLASKEFNTVIQQYPTHPKVPDAMLKLAIIHDDAGQHAQAKQELQKVVKQFPNSAAAKLAKMRLQAM